MTRNGIRWSKRAFRQLSELPPRDSQLLYQAVSKLEAFPDCANVGHLVNHRYGYRLRVGHYRVLFNYAGGERIISIEEVRKRDEHTY